MLVVGRRIDDTYYNRTFNPREYAYRTEGEVIDVIEMRIVLRPKERFLKIEYLGKDQTGKLFYIHPEENKFVPTAEDFTFKRCGDIYISGVFPVDRTPSGVMEHIKSVLDNVAIIRKNE